MIDLRVSWTVSPKALVAFSPWRPGLIDADNSQQLDADNSQQRGSTPIRP
jgi:hypothetical protein